MLYNIISEMQDSYFLRSFLSFFISLLFSFMIYPKAIEFFIKIQNGGQPIRCFGPESHLQKQGTPTMGGVVLILAIVFASLICGDYSNIYLISVIIVTISFGILGFIDDLLKIRKRNSDGISAKMKFLFQSLICIIACYMVQNSFDESLQMKLAIPIFKDLLLDLGVFYYIFSIFVIVGSSNAVNLTDGLDGLAIMPIMITAISLGIITMICGSFEFANEMSVNHIENISELLIFISAIIGAGLAFLWYNATPAQIFMGDVGSLAMGGALATISMICKSEIIFSIIGGVFVIETISVMMQVSYFKFTGGKRIFRMTPIHHHFEQLGLSETKIVIRFWIAAIIFAIVGMSIFLANF